MTSGKTRPRRDGLDDITLRILTFQRLTDTAFVTLARRFHEKGNWDMADSASTLTPSQTAALEQLQAITNGGDPDVAIGVLASVDWDVQVSTAA